MADLSTIYYGVWIPRKGFLKVQRDGHLSAFADINKEVAAEIARVIGRQAKVRFIDASIASLEDELLEAERERRIINRMAQLWDTLTSYYNFRT